MYDRAFKIAGYDVAISPDGEAALEHLRSAPEKPSVIMMDVAMPKMGGLALLKEIKKQPVLASIPVAVLTNSYTEETADQFMAGGANLYLVKISHSSKEIVQKMDELIEKGSVADTSH
jgi:CheY-like chemotaxis protein